MNIRNNIVELCFTWITLGKYPFKSHTIFQAKFTRGCTMRGMYSTGRLPRILGSLRAWKHSWGVQQKWGNTFASFIKYSTDTRVFSPIFIKAPEYISPAIGAAYPSPWHGHSVCKERSYNDYSRRSSVFKKIGRCDPDRLIHRETRRTAGYTLLQGFILWEASPLKRKLLQIMLIMFRISSGSREVGIRHFYSFVTVSQYPEPQVGRWY